MMVYCVGGGGGGSNGFFGKYFCVWRLQERLYKLKVILVETTDMIRTHHYLGVQNCTIVVIWPGYQLGVLEHPRNCIKTTALDTSGWYMVAIRETIQLQTSDMGKKTVSVLAHSFLLPLRANLVYLPSITPWVPLELSSEMKLKWVC